MEYLAYLLSMLAILSILALSQSLLVGYAGIVFVAGAGFMGLGAYISALLTIHTQAPLGIAIIGGALGTAVLGTVFLLGLSRLRRDYLALATLGGGIMLFDIFSNWTSLTRGRMGLTGVRALTTSTYRSLLVLGLFFLAAVLLHTFLSRSKLGCLLRAFRDDEVLARSLGYSPARFRGLAFAFSFALCGVAGGLFAHYAMYIDPTSFGPGESILILSMVIAGGSEGQLGPILGAAAFLFLPELLRFVNVSPAAAAHVRQGLFGILLMVLMVLRPQGMAGTYAMR